MSTETAKISFSFGGPSKSVAATTVPSNLELLMAKAKAPFKPSQAPKPLLLNDEDDDSAVRKDNTRNALAGPSGTSINPPVQQPVKVSRAERRAQQEALRVDSTVFDYDSVYDGMKAAERKLDDAKKVESEDRKPKYIENFLASAQTRRLDRLRAEEKMLQLEREKEGDEFEDKDKFVTEAYKKQMAEVRKAEEEEKQREDALRKSKKGPGLTALYKSMLDGDEEKHAAAMAAASASTSSGPSLAIRPPRREDDYEPEAEYDPFLAREAAGTTQANETTGQDVEINDDGEVVDKRSLLKAGLNIMKKPKPELPSSLFKKTGTALEGPYKSRAVGTAASYQERMERERRRLAEEVKLEAERKKEDAERKMNEEEEAARKRREGDNGEAERKRMEAKERFIARKRIRDEEEKHGNKRAKEEE